ncbi:MAG: mechanosensitive ion channel [Saprospiraceae bacterium]|nr:mechanosensitive ion channel [Saprospiraceae bacterium]
MDTQAILNKAIELAWAYGPKTLAALALLFGGWWIIRRFTRGFDKFLQTRRMDEGLRPFFTTLVDTGMKAVLMLMVASTVGIATTSFIAIFSAIAFSVGLALQGSLGNFASGVLIQLFRPFRVGDWITVAGHSGKVVEIQTFNTILITETRKKIIVPNGKITEGPIENIPHGVELQAEITILLSAQTALDQLQEAAELAAKRCPNILAGKEVEVKVRGISRDDLKADIAVWTLGQHHEDTLNDLYAALRTTFSEQGIELAKERRRDLV